MPVIWRRRANLEEEESKIWRRRRANLEEESSWSAPPPAAQLLLTIHPQEKVYHEGAKKLRGLSGSRLLGASSSLNNLAIARPA